MDAVNDLLARHDVAIQKVEFENDQNNVNIFVRLTVCFPNNKINTDIIEGLQRISGITKASIK
jgi:ribosome-binding factor A